MTRLRRQILVFTVYTIVFVVFVLFPVGVTVLLVWLFGGTKDFVWPLAVGGLALLVLGRSRGMIHEYILGQMRKGGFPDLRNPRQN